MKTVITLTGKELIKLLEDKYPDAHVEYVWLDLHETQEHFQVVNRRKPETPDELGCLCLRIHADGSFQRPLDNPKS